MFKVINFSSIQDFLFEEISPKSWLQKKILNSLEIIKLALLFCHCSYCFKKEQLFAKNYEKNVTNERKKGKA